MLKIQCEEFKRLVFEKSKDDQFNIIDFLFEYIPLVFDRRGNNQLFQYYEYGDFYMINADIYNYYDHDEFDSFYEFISDHINHWIDNIINQLNSKTININNCRKELLQLLKTIIGTKYTISAEKSDDEDDSNIYLKLEKNNHYILIATNYSIFNILI